MTSANDLVTVQMRAIDVIQLYERAKRKKFSNFMHDLLAKKGVTWIPHAEELKAAKELVESEQKLP